MSCKCDEFLEPTVPDLGRCHAHRLQIDCEAPVLPVAQCLDDTFTYTYNPAGDPPWTVTAKLFDSNCEPILDSGGIQITTTIQ